jgi:hypothetical protein
MKTAAVGDREDLQAALVFMFLPMSRKDRNFKKESG